MADFLFFVHVFIVFGIIYFLDLIFTSCMLFPYIRFLHEAGLAIKPFVICWETKSLNRLFMRWGSSKSNFLRRWFQVGAFIVTLSVIPALCLIFVPVFQYFAYYNSTPILMPIVPGLNLPYSQLLYYSLALFICAAFHEFGHALAASREKVPIQGIGIDIYGIFPMAHVRIGVEEIKQLNISQQLCIFSAGIWHNLVLAAFVLVLVLVNPYILSATYQQGHGITVVDVKQGSGIGQEGGFMKEDTITGINECFIQTEANWRKCIHQEYTNIQAGYCVDLSFYKLEDIIIAKNETSKCCSGNSKNMCFRVLENKELELRYKPATYLFIQQNLGNFFCLPARKVVEGVKMCREHHECQDLCLIPVLASESERFLRIERSSKKAVFYIGTSAELVSSVAVSPWVSKYASVYYVDMYELLLGYVFSFSCGLAIINTIPLFCLDGNYIIECIIKRYFKSFISVLVYHRIVFAFKIAGCVGVLLCLLVSVLKYSTESFK